MAALKPVRGTHDLIGEDARRHRHVIETARTVAARFGFEDIVTPVFEFTEVFARTLGETSDVVSKEMYTFETKGGDLLTLRPENTAGVARAFISNGLAQQVPFKGFYAGPMFRYERPQKGRQRQFHQVGVELLGVEKPQADVEVIAAGQLFLKELGLGDLITLELNTLGDPESRNAYREQLVAFLKDHYDSLSEDSKTRLEVNPLRVLDSKDEGDRKIVADAPLLVNCLNDASQQFYDELREGLTNLGIAFTENPRLVRGLDYYGHTAFEFTTDALGAQGTVLAGGRYDGLIKQMGGAQTPGVGWASGVERLALMVAEQAFEAPRPISFIPMGEAAQVKSMALSHELRENGFNIDLGYSGNMKKRLTRANKLKARAAILLGDNELEQGIATVRDLDTGDQEEVKLDDLASALVRFR